MDTIDLSYLSDKERRKIQAVLERDAQMQKKEEQRLERLKTKADKTKNPVILKKIRMRSGQWFVELQQSSRFKRRGVDTVRSSIRLAKSRRGSRVDVSTISPMVSPCPTPAEPQTRLAPPPAPTLPPVIEQEPSENNQDEIALSTETEPLPSGAEPPPSVVVNSDKDPEPVEAKEDPPQQEPEEKPEEAAPVEEEKPEPVAPEEAEKPPSPKTWGKLSRLTDIGIFGSKPNSDSEKEDLPVVVEEPEPTPEDAAATSVEVVAEEQVTVDVTVQQPAEETATAEEAAAIEAGVDSPSHVVIEAPGIPPSSLEDISGPPVAVEVQVTTPEVEVAAEGPADAGSAKGKRGSTQSLNLLKPKRSGSMLSLASTKSGIFSSSVSQVTGSVRLGFSYNNQKGTLMILVVSCSNLSTVEKKLANPYVKTYLMPDKAKNSKRKTKIKKKTINPNYNETLKYKISESELATRVLNVGIWHDKVGYNVFLGEVNINMDEVDLNNADPVEYELKPRGMDEIAEDLTSYNGEIEIALRFQADHGMKTLADSDIGQLDAVVKKVKNVSPQGRNGQCNLFIKGYFLPDRFRQTKQKSPTIVGASEITFDHLFSYTNVEVADLQHRCLELRVFDQSKIGSHRLVGGVRVGCGSGMSLDQPVEWMDSHEQEKNMWEGCLAAPGTWVEGVLDLRKLEPRK